MCSSSGDRYELLTAAGGCWVVVASSWSSHLRGGGGCHIIVETGRCC